MLDVAGVQLEPEAFSVGFRIEHPQSLIDQAAGVTRQAILISALPNTSWFITPETAVVYSFCMCPSGLWWAPPRSRPCGDQRRSQHSRNERNANSGLVVNLEPEDLGLTPPP